MRSQLKRRELITLLGGAAAWPLAARAQRADHVRRIGVLSGAGGAGAADGVGAVLQGLQQLGWSDGRNAQIDRRWGGGNVDDIRKHAAELVALAPDVILTAGAATVGPLMQATRTVPIVFTTVIDPVGAGFVNSLS